MSTKATSMGGIAGALFLSLLGSAPNAHATFHVAAQNYTVSQKIPFENKAAGTNYPQAYRVDAKYVFTLHEGELRDVLREMARKYRWRVRWYPTESWHVLSTHTLRAQSFPRMTRPLLKHYPVHVTYDVSKRIVTVRARHTTRRHPAHRF